MEFGFACDLYLQDTEPRVRETTLEQKRYYIESTLKPYFQGMLVGDIDAKTVIDWENHLLECRTSKGVTYNLLRTLTAAQSRYQKTWRLPLV